MNNMTDKPDALTSSGSGYYLIVRRTGISGGAISLELLSANVTDSWIALLNADTTYNVGWTKKTGNTWESVTFTRNTANTTGNGTFAAYLNRATKEIYVRCVGLELSSISEGITFGNIALPSGFTIPSDALRAMFYAETVSGRIPLPFHLYSGTGATRLWTLTGLTAIQAPLQLFGDVVWKLA